MPRGRPKGSRNKFTLLREKALRGELDIADPFKALDDLMAADDTAAASAAWEVWKAAPSDGRDAFRKPGRPKGSRSSSSYDKRNVRVLLACDPAAMTKQDYQALGFTFGPKRSR
jgi:hypothetical protein